MAKKKASLGCLFWMAAVLLVIVIILFNMKQVGTVLESTGLDKFIGKYFKPGEREPRVTIQPLETTPPTTGEPAAPAKTEVPEKISLEVEQNTPEPTPEPIDKKLNTRNANIYYTYISQDGEIENRAVKRKVAFSNSPLTSTLEVLLEGPDLKESNSGLHNLIPPETIIRNIYIKGNTAYISFNENFRFNTLGREGIDAQLQQIVFTATEFTNVASVQVLIEGKVVEYLGPEGGYIGQPLSRESF